MTGRKITRILLHFPATAPFVLQLGTSRGIAKTLDGLLPLLQSSP